MWIYPALEQIMQKKCCSSIQFIKNINFVNKKIESTFNIFNDCKSIEHLNLEKFRTDNVTNMMCMFIIALN